LVCQALSYSACRSVLSVSFAVAFKSANSSSRHVISFSFARMFLCGYNKTKLTALLALARRWRCGTIHIRGWPVSRFFRNCRSLLLTRSDKRHRNEDT